MIIDMKDISDKILWTKGYEAGVELERNRIHKAIYDYFRLFDGASNRTHKISEVELITLIKTEAEHDSSIRAGHSSTSGI